VRPDARAPGARSRDETIDPSSLGIRARPRSLRANRSPTRAHPDPASPQRAQTIALHQFKVFFVAFVSAASETRGNALWQAAQPSLENVARVMEQTLGRAAGFNPNTTHVLLTALTLAVIICAERIRSAMFEAAKKHGDRMERIGR
jgi:hypothetical protein